MNAFQTCKNTSDAVPLYLPQQLYLKPIARLKISLQLPQRTMGKSISNWEVMEKLRSMIRPEEFCILKVTKTNLDVIRLEAEIDDKSKLEKVISRLDNKTIKLKEFPELMRLRACEAKLNFPTRHSWDAFFREAKDMNEMKAGERPDTIHISNLPIKWFVTQHLSGEDDVKPSEKIFYRVFEKFGLIRHVDIPVCDPYRNKMKAEVSGMQTFDFNEGHLFEGYVQFKDYVGFTRTMDAFRGMKLLHKEGGEAYTFNINVDFDRTKHLSDASIRRREIVRDRLVRKEIDKEEKERREKEEEERKKQAERQQEIEEKNAKERRRREREEKRKAKILAKLKLKGADEINDKIAKEEKKLLKAKRKLEAIRLVEELFKRIKNKREKDLMESFSRTNNEDELTKLKNSSELLVQQQKEKVNRAIEGRVVLKSILAGRPHAHSHDDKSSSSISSDDEKLNKRKREGEALISNDVTNLNPHVYPADNLLPAGDWYGYSNNAYPYHVPPIYSPVGHIAGYFPYHSRGRGGIRGAMPGPSRGPSHGYPRRGRGSRYRGGFRGNKTATYPPELQEQYYRYFEKFLYEHDDRSHHSYSKSRSRSRSRRRSPIHSKSRSRSYKRTRSRSRSLARRRSKNYKLRSNSRSRSRTRKSRTRSKRRSRSRAKRSSSKSNTLRRSKSAKKRTKSRSRSRKQKSRERSKSRSPSYRSIDSSKFISPSRLRIPRSKSWSLPRESGVAHNKNSWS